MLSNFTIVGIGDSSVQDLQNSVLDCIVELIFSLDKSLLHAAVNLIQCDMCGCI